MMPKKYRETILFIVFSAVVVVLALMAQQTTATPPAGLTPNSYLPVALRPENTPTYTPTATKTPIPTSTTGPTNTPVPTNTPTPSPTSAPPANVLMTQIEYNPPGDDVAGEFVEIRNFGGTAANMTGWSLRDPVPHVFTFPSFTLQPGAAVKVWTKSGVNNAANLYWGSNQAIWNNTGDTATLRNSGGQTIDTCTYSGGGQNASC
jgi:hypothetical protein